MVLRHRSRAAETPAGHDADAVACRLQHRHDLAATEKDRARPRYSRRHIIPDPARARRQADHQRYACSGRGGDSEAYRRFWSQRADHQPARPRSFPMKRPPGSSIRDWMLKAPINSATSLRQPFISALRLCLMESSNLRPSFKAPFLAATHKLREDLPWKKRAD